MRSAWEQVEMARKLERPKSLDYITNVFDEFMEFHGDRSFGDDLSIIGGIASLDGKNITVIGQQKGKNTKENMKRNFGMTNPEGYRKALRLMKQAEKFNRPIVTLIDTPGAYPGMGAEERGQGEAIARNIMEMSTLKVPVICIIIGEGSSGGALALGVGDRVVMFENSVYSILSPEGFASILYKDATLYEKAAKDMKMTAKELKKMGMIDDILKEPDGGADQDPELVYQEMKKYLNKTIGELEKISVEKLLQMRYDKFRKIGR